MVVMGMVGTQFLLGLDRCGRRIVEECEILRGRSDWKTSSCPPLVEYTDLAGVWERVVGARSPDFFCNAGFRCGALVVGARRAPEVEILKMIRPFSPNLRDVS